MTDEGLPNKDTREQNNKDTREQNKDTWEAASKPINSLMVAHAAGLVTCLTLLKDYDNTPQLKGLGVFISLFGLGLLAAVLSATIWVIIRPLYIYPQEEHRQAVRGLLRTTGALAVLSMGLMATAIVIGIYRFASL